MQVDDESRPSPDSDENEPSATLLALFETGDGDDCERLSLIRLTVDSTGKQLLSVHRHSGQIDPQLELAQSSYY